MPSAIAALDGTVQPSMRPATSTTTGEIIAAALDEVRSAISRSTVWLRVHGFPSSSAAIFAWYQ